MDSQKMPEITVEKREDEKEKKRSGLFGFLDLFGKGGGSFSGALGGAGAGGGLLATKAGLIGLILVGSTLAGGIGVVGYKTFGPGSNGADGRYSSIFAQKSKEQIAAEAAAERQAAASGESASLSDLAKANAGAMGAPQQPGAADAANPTDKTKQDASAIADAAKAAAAAKGKDNNTNIGGNKAASLKSDRKIGELSKLGGGAAGGGGGSGAAFSTAGQAPQTGKLAGFSAGARPDMIKGGQSRARKFGSTAKEQLKGLAGDAGNKTSMQSVGAGFDGNGAPATIGDHGQATGGAGETGSSPTGATPTSSPGTGGEGNRFATNVPPTTAANVTPWQAALNTAMMCIAAAALLLYAIKMTSKMGAPYGTILAYAMAGVAAMLGAYVIYLGSLIGGNFYGQRLQGNMMEMAGTFITAAAATAMFDIKGAQDGPTPIMYLCGAAALGATAMAYLSPMRSFPPSDFKNGLPPDYDYKATDFKGRTN
jgi:hypothetical protein